MEQLVDCECGKKHIIYEDSGYWTEKKNFEKLMMMPIPECYVLGCVDDQLYCQAPGGVTAQVGWAPTNCDICAIYYAKKMKAREEYTKDNIILHSWGDSK